MTTNNNKHIERVIEDFEKKFGLIESALVTQQNPSISDWLRQTLQFLTEEVRKEERERIGK